ncbi:MAG: hypothetical protein ABI583_12265 [Betaproteobacteria bacterium]
MIDRKKSAGNAGEPDNEFDRELAMVSRAYRDSDAGSDGPPAAIDDAIRAAARRAVKSGPRSASKSWVSRWSAPLSAAALVVLTTSVGFLALDEKPELAPALPKETLTKNEPPTSAAAGRASSPGRSAPIVAKAPAAPLTAPASEKKALAEERNVASRDQLAQALKPMPERNRSETTIVAPRIEIADQSDRVATADSPVAATPAAAAPVAKAATGFVADPRAAGAIVANKDNAAPAAKLAKHEAALDGRSSELQANAGVAGRADAVRPAQEAKARAQATAALPPTVATTLVLAPPVYAPAAPPAQTAYASAPAPAARQADQAIEPAEVWMKRILELKKHSKAGEFDEELAKFRKQYPSFKLPDELKTDK